METGSKQHILFRLERILIPSDKFARFLRVLEKTRQYQLPAVEENGILYLAKSNYSLFCSTTY